MSGVRRLFHNNDRLGGAIPLDGVQWFRKAGKELLANRQSPLPHGASGSSHYSRAWPFSQTS